MVEESDGGLMGDGVNIAARSEGIAKPGAICMSVLARIAEAAGAGIRLSLGWGDFHG